MLGIARRYWLFVGWFLLIPLFFASSGWSASAGELGAATPVGMQDPACPGDVMATPITGTSESGVPSPEAMVRGEPLTGRWWDPGARSFWHCHGGGQYIIVMEGVGRVQKRGERMRDLHLGEIEFAGPGVEHWHGASDTEGTRVIQQSLSIDGGSGVFWMEEVTSDDYLGNDIGISSRMRFLETGER